MLVDGAAVVDPATNAFIGYSHMCNGFEIPEPGVDFYDLKDIPNGNVVIKLLFQDRRFLAPHLRLYAARLLCQPEEPLPGFVSAARRRRRSESLD